MKRITLFVFLFILTISAFCQGFVTAKVKPPLPNINDSIIIIDTAWVPDAGNYLMSSEIVKNGNNISITNCYNCSQGFTIISFLCDSMRLGKLQAGQYNCTLYSREYTDTAIHCDQLPNRDTFTFYFTVSQYPNSISDIDLSTVSIAPNPSRNKLTINSAVSDMDISVFDASGREFNVPHTRSEIDISSLASGVYCLRIQTRNSSVVKRFIKE